MKDLSCPVCNADVPLSGDERPGDELFCSYCGARSRLSARVEDEQVELEEDP